jgi:hypothetical protein
MNRLSQLLTSRFGASQRYWRLQRRWRQLWFAATRQRFRLREASTRSKANFRGFRALSRLIVAPALFGAVSVVVLHLLEPVWPHVVADVGLSGTDLGTAVTRPISGSAYSIMLQSIAAVTGVFLALYFASLNTVAATVYTTVPHDIRELIVRDRLGNVYVRVVAYLTALSIFLLVVQAGGAAPYHLALPVLALASAFAIFSFIKLGERAFYLADPTLLVDIPASDFVRWASGATTRGWRWADANVQNHYRQRAKSSLETIGSLLRISASRRHLHGAPELRLVKATCISLARYLSLKGDIPTESRWFGRRFSHKQWFLTTSTELEMATETATQLSPEEVPDMSWVEGLSFDALLETFASDLADARYDDLNAGIAHVANVWEIFGLKWQSNDGLDGVERLSEFLTRAVTQPGGAESPKAELAFLGALDQLAFLPSAIEVGLYKTAVAVSPEQLRMRLAAADWSDPASPYLFDLPRKAVETLEEVAQGIRFESAAATPVRTPGWYVADLGLNRLAWAIHDEIERCLAFAEKWYPTTADQLSEAGQFEGAGAILARGLEAAWKLASHCEQLSTIATELGAEIILADLPRPKWDWESYSKRVEALRREVLKRLAKSIPDLATGDAPRHEDRPDYLGQAVHRTGEACFEALVAGDPELFDELFRPYFLGVFIMVEQLRPQVADWTDLSTAVTWMTEPLIDLIDISGYALIFSEYHHRPDIWDHCRDLWARYLTPDDAGTERLRFLNTASAHHQHLFAITPRSVLRTRREMVFGRMLEQLPREPATDDPFHEQALTHDSALIRKLAPAPGGLGTSYLDATDVFVAQYLRTLPNATEFDFGIHTEKLADLARLNEETSEE